MQFKNIIQIYISVQQSQAVFPVEIFGRWNTSLMALIFKQHSRWRKMIKPCRNICCIKTPMWLASIGDEPTAWTTMTETTVDCCRHPGQVSPPPTSPSPVTFPTGALIQSWYRYSPEPLQYVPFTYWEISIGHEKLNMNCEIQKTGHIYGRLNACIHEILSKLMLPLQDHPVSYVGKWLFRFTHNSLLQRTCRLM